MKKSVKFALLGLAAAGALLMTGCGDDKVQRNLLLPAKRSRDS